MNQASSPPTKPPLAIPGLDGLRALAILLVIAWHCAQFVGFPLAATGVLRPLVELGWAGVDLFFALSGFLITRLLLSEEEATGRIDMGRFYARRALRLLPAFYTVVLLCLFVLPRVPAFAAVAPQDPPPLEILAVASYWSNYYYALLAPQNFTPVFMVFWSLCVEEHFYLIWPVLLRLLRRRSARALLAASVGAFLCGLRLFALEGLPVGVVHNLSHFRVDSILWGALAALIRLDSDCRTVERRSILAAASAVVLWVKSSGHGSPLDNTLLLTALALAAASLVAEVASGPRNRLTRMLGFRPLRFVGRVSYGMYLLHLPAIALVAPAVIQWSPLASPASFGLFFSAATLTSVVVAAAMFVVVERPFQQLKGRYTPARAFADP